MAFLKPQNPMTKGSDYFYPLTTADQVIMDGGYRLNDIVGKVKKSTITLYANGWSVEVPHCYSVIVDGLSNNTDMKILPRFPEDFESKQIMREETAKISFASRNNNILTFECWDEIPTIDIPIDIEINILYPNVPDINLNYSIIGGTTEPENPSENMIWINTENEITSHKLSKYEPNNPVEGMVWIYLGDASNVNFHTLSMNERELDEVHPISAKQYIGGVYVDVTAKSYQGGEWVDWSVTLYPPGSNWNTATSGNGHATINGDGITLKEEWISYSQYQQATTQSKWDVTGFNKLRARMKTSSTGCTKVVALSAVASSNVRDGSFAAKVQNATQTPETIFECDISGLSGEYYVVVGQYIESGNSNKFTIFDKVWME